MFRKLIITTTLLLTAVFADLECNISPVNGASNILPTASIVITITDPANSATNIGNVTIRVNGVITSAVTTNTTDGYVYTINPAPVWGTRTTINVQAIADNGSGDINTTSSYTTMNPPAPNAPTITWVNSSDYNTTNNQTIRVNRPSTVPNYIQGWRISSVSGTGLSTISSISTSNSYYDFTQVADRQTVSVSIQWIASTSNISSAQSPTTAFIIGDRTPPEVWFDDEEKENGYSIEEPILFIIPPPFNDINTGNIKVTLNNSIANFTISSNIFPDEEDDNLEYLIIMIIPNNPFYYNTSINVTASIYDISGNYTTVTHSYKTENIPTPSFYSGYLSDGGGNLIINMPDNIPTHVDKWEVLVITSKNGTISTTNSTANMSVAIPVSDNQTVTVSMRWIASLQTPSHSVFSEAVVYDVTKTTPPTISNLNPSPSSTEVSVTSDITFKVFDNENDPVSVDIQVNGYWHNNLSEDSTIYTLSSNIFEYNATINVTINATNSYHPNCSTEVTYSFFTVTDHIPPSIFIISPTPNEQDLSSPITISFRVTDNLSGINTASISVSVNNTKITTPYTIIRESDNSYIIETTSTVPYNATNNISIYVEDIAHNPKTVSWNIKTKLTPFRVLPGNTYYALLQEAINNTPINGEIVIEPGLYTEKNINISEKTLTIRPNSDGQIILDAEGSGYHFYIMNSTITFNNFTLMNGNNSNGGSIRLINSTFNIYESTFTGNTASSSGGAISSSSGNKVYLKKVKAINNSANMGAFYYSDGLNIISIEESLFAENQVNNDYSLFYTPSDIKISRTDFINNNNGYLFRYGSVLLENCTIYNNPANIGCDNTAFKAVNSIIWNNGTPGTTIFNNITPNIINSNVSPNSYVSPIYGPDNISQTPQVSINYTDYIISLLPNDPGIDRGTSNIQAFAYIYDQYDIGSHEYDGIYISHVTPAPGSLDIDTKASINFTVRDQNNEISDLQVTLITPSGNETINDFVITTLNHHYITAEFKASLNYYATVTVQISATSNSGENHLKTFTYKVRNPELKYINFNRPSFNALENSNNPISINVRDALNVSMNNIPVNFSIIGLAGQLEQVISLNILTAVTNASGNVFITLNVGNVFESTPITISAYAQGVTANLSVLVKPKVRVAQNTNTNNLKYYSTIQEALNEASAGDIIQIVNDYAEAEPNEKTDITWPNINNLTLKANNVTLNNRITIPTNIIANISGIVFEEISQTVIFISSSGFTVNIDNCKFINNNPVSNSVIRINGAGMLNITDCDFENNPSASAIHTYNTNCSFTIIRSRFSNNDIGLKLEWSSTGYISQTLMKNNTTAVENMSTGASLNLLIENSLIVSNKTGLNLDNFSAVTVNFSTIVSNNTAIKLGSSVPTLNLINSIIWGNTPPLNVNKIYGINSITQQELLASINCYTTDPYLDAEYIPSINSVAVNNASENFKLDVDYSGTRPMLYGYDIGARELAGGSNVAMIIGKSFYPSIELALTAAEDNDTIYIVDGTHYLNNSLVWPDKQNITLRGLSKTDSIIIGSETTSSNDAKAFIINGKSVDLTLEDLTIGTFNNVIYQGSVSNNYITMNNLILNNNRAVSANNNIARNGSILYTEYPTNLSIKDSLFNNNSADGGGKLFFTANGKTNLYITQTTINNTGSNESTGLNKDGGIAYHVNALLEEVNISTAKLSGNGGVFASSNITLNKSNIIGANVTGTGGVFYDCNVTINNSLIKNNRTYSLSSGGVFANSTINVNHSVFTENGSATPGQKFAVNTKGIISNSILWKNDSESSFGSSNTITLNYCAYDHYTSIAGTNNIIVNNSSILNNPYFIDEENNDYRVSYNSILIDSGDDNPEYIYDRSDIGLYEYPDTYLSHYAPAQYAQNVPINQNIHIRVRNSLKSIDPETIQLKVDTMNYNTQDSNISISNNILTDEERTDFEIIFTPSKKFFYSKVITINIQVDDINHTYTIETQRPIDIYISKYGSDDETTHDGSYDLPFKTIAKAMDIAGEECKLFVLTGNYTEPFNWTNSSKVSLIGTRNTIISSNINISNDVTANITNITYKGQITNAGKLLIDGIQALDNNTTLVNNNNATAYIQNSLFVNNNTAIQNNGTLTVVYSNLVSNNVAVNNSDTARFINNIIYQNNTAMQGNIPTEYRSNLETDPWFVDESFLEIDPNSPAVDAAAEDIQIPSTDIRQIARPQHRQPDIGAYESNKPKIIIDLPNDLNNVLITPNWSIRVIDNLDSLTTENIQLYLTTSNYRITINTFTVESDNYGWTLIASANSATDPRGLLDTNTTYNLIITAKNSSENISTLSTVFKTQPDITELYVSRNYTAGGESGFADQPFYTLQKAVNYVVRKNLPQITINILTGEYTQGVTVNFTNSGPTQNNIVILGNGSTLNANSNGRFFNISGNYNVIIRDLNLVSGNATGSSAAAYGGAIYTSVSTNILLERVNFINNKAQTYGGAIYSQGNTAINNSYFIQNNSQYGGTMRISRGKTTINATVFENNFSTGYGGGIYIDGSSNFYGTNLIASGNIVSVNATNANGGFLYSSTSGTVHIEKSLFRNNSTNSANGGAIYNSNSNMTLINNIFDYNKANSGGAIYNYSNSPLNIYHNSFIRNTASTNAGAIYNDSTTYKIQNSLFMLNTRGTTTITSSHLGGNIIPTTTGSVLSDVEGDPKLVNDVFNYDYYPNPESTLLIDKGVTPDITINSDYKNTLRPLDNGYDIGAYEYRPLIQIPPRSQGYYATSDDNNNFKSSATVVIGRKINGQEIGSITIPSSNQLNYNDIDLPPIHAFNDIVITLNRIEIPSSNILAQGGKVYELTLYASNNDLFISVNNTVITDYEKNIIENTHLSGNVLGIIPTDNGCFVTVTATSGGSFELVYPASIIVSPSSLFKKQYTSSTLNVQVLDKYNGILSGVPVTLNLDNLSGTLDPSVTTSNTKYTHSGSAETGTINAAYSDLPTAHITVITVVDHGPPTINKISPASLSDVSITTNIIFSITDEHLATESLRLQINDEYIPSSDIAINASGEFVYNRPLTLNTIYAVTINVSDLVENHAEVTFSFQTKTDTTPPAIVHYPVDGQQNLLAEEIISFNIQDWESGIAVESLRLTINGQAILSSSGRITLTTINDNELHVAYAPIFNEFQLGDFVTVNFSITDKNGNLSSVNFTYKIVFDTEPPNIIITYPAAGQITSASFTLRFTVTDSVSEISPNSIEVWVDHGTGLSKEAGHITMNISDKRIDAVMDLQNLGYNQPITINIKAKDIAYEGYASTTISFRTNPDTIPPVITPIQPLSGAINVSASAQIIIDLRDYETSLTTNTTYPIFRVNGTSRPAGTAINRSPSNNHRITYTPSGNLLYGSTYNIYVETVDIAGNTVNLTYTFTTEDDIYPPESPTLNPFTFTTTNMGLLPLSGEISEPGILHVLANGKLLTTKNYSTKGEFNLTLNVQDILKLVTPAAVINLEAVLYDLAKVPNPSASSNIITIELVSKFVTIGNFSVEIPAGTFDQDISPNIKVLEYYNMPTNLIISENYAADIFVSPKDSIQLAPVTIYITLPAGGISAEHNVYYYNTQTNKWEKIPDFQINGNILSFTTDHLSIYALGILINANNTKLDTYEFILAPNPVKLDKEPLHFVYKIPNDCTAEVRIYTANGRLLTRFNKDLRATGDSVDEFIWDGENNWNERIGNGVYLAYISLENQVTGEKKSIRTKIAVLN